MAKQLSKAQYEEVTLKLLSKGYTAETVYDALKSANFQVKLEGEVYSIYAARVIAIMHNASEANEEEEALDLD